MSEIDKHRQGWRDQQCKNDFVHGVQFALAFLFVILFFAFLAV